MAVLVYFNGCLYHLIDALLGERRSEDDGEVGEWCKTAAYGVLHSLDGFGALVFHKVPLVDAHHESFFILLNEREDVGILRLDAASGIYHQHAHIAVFDGAYAAYHRVVFYVFVHLDITAPNARTSK